MNKHFTETILTNQLQKLYQTLEGHPDAEHILADYISDIGKLTDMYIKKAQIYSPQSIEMNPLTHVNTLSYYPDFAYPRKKQSARQTTLPHEEIALRKASKQTGLTYIHIKQLWTHRLKPNNATEEYAMRIVQQIIHNYAKQSAKNN